MNESEINPVFIGIGSNLQNPSKQVRLALRELSEIPHTRCLASSALYRSTPFGPQNQPDYINAVAKLSTRLEAESLLDHLQALEQRHHRIRAGVRWGPRTLDLDLLLYADRCMDTPRLQVPHPHMAERSFVLVPLAELASKDLLIPGFGLLGELLEKLPLDNLARLA